MPTLTIVTATWNRRHLLPRLFASLENQDAPQGSFEWLVVDDGSTDGTRSYIETLARFAPFRVRLIVQDHGGKHRALNRASREVTSPWLLALDSDDWILPGGIDAALSDIAAAERTPDTLAIVSPRVFAGRVPPAYPRHPAPLDYATWRSKYFKSDFSMLARTAILQKYPFPEFDGETFIAESAVYARAFAQGGIRLSNTRIMGAEYQHGGLTTKMRNNRALNPRGALYTYRCQLDAGVRGTMRARSWMNYHRFFSHARAAGTVPHTERTERLAGGRVWRVAGWLLFLTDLRHMRHRTR